MRKGLCSLVMGTALLGVGSHEMNAQEPHSVDASTQETSAVYLAPKDRWLGHKDLLRMDVPMPFVASLSGDEALRVSSYFTHGYAPTKWSRELCLDQWKTVQSQVQAHSNSSLSRDVLIKTIQEHLTKRLSLSRTNMSELYHENTFPLDKISDTTHLVLLKMYGDLFSSDSFWDVVRDFFPSGEYSYEHIGVVRFEDDLLRVYEVDGRLEDRFERPSLMYRPRDSIHCPAIVPYINHVGIIHSHIRDGRELGEEIAGPSSSDLKLMDHHHTHNPYQTNVVVTYLDDSHFNVDVYLKNVILEDSVVVNKGEYIVYDFGTFEKDMLLEE